MYIRVVESGSPAVKFLKLQAIEHANSEGLVKALDDAFSDFGFTADQLKLKLVGFGADGAARNLGVTHQSVSTIQRSIAPWMVQIHCMAHRLELSLKDCFKDTYFERTIVDTLASIYHFYRSSPKRLRELKTVAEWMEMHVQHQPEQTAHDGWITK